MYITYNSKKHQMKRLLFLFVSLGLLFHSAQISSKNTKKESSDIPVLHDSIEQKLLNQVNRIKQLIKANPKYNKEIAFLIDMRIMSGKNRFFVYDLKNDKIIDQGLVAHGLGSGNETSGELKFSNTPNSFCTSLGKYAIGSSYNGQYGKAYKLYGLEKTNNNALARNIVLHKYERVPCEEQDQPICKSLGCPMVNTEYYSRIEKIIDSSKSNIILDIYY